MKLNDRTMVIDFMSTIDPDYPIVGIMSIDGDPKSKERPRFNVETGRVITSSRQRAAEEALGWEAKAQWYGGPLKEKVALVAIFYLGTRRKADHDNLGKHLCDALNGIVWEDDSQVIDARYRVDYDVNHPRTVAAVAMVKDKE